MSDELNDNGNGTVTRYRSSLPSADHCNGDAIVHVKNDYLEVHFLKSVKGLDPLATHEAVARIYLSPGELMNLATALANAARNAPRLPRI